MWELIEPGKNTPAGVQWIVDGLRNGSLIWTTDGSYDRKQAVDLFGVGWMIFCTATGFCVTSTFWELSPLASSYGAKLLVLCALHLFARALAEFCKIVGWSAMLCCENKCASMSKLPSGTMKLLQMKGPVVAKLWKAINPVSSYYSV